MADTDQEPVVTIESLLKDFGTMSWGVPDDAVMTAMDRPDWREIFEAFDEHYGFDPANYDCNYNGTLLHIATSGGKFEIAEYLLSCGADPHGKTIYQMSHLEQVAMHRDEGAPVLSQLLALGVKTEDDRALHMAAAAGCLDKLQVLLGAKMSLKALEAGPDKDIPKGTPLHEAAAAHFTPAERLEYRNNRWDPEEQEKVIKALLDAGADPESEDDRGRKPAEWAAIRPGYKDPRFKVLDDERSDDAVDEQKHIERIEALLTRSK